jgi:protein arginine kinase
METSENKFSLHSATDKKSANYSIDSFLKNPAKWLEGTGKNADIVISSRIRLARNLKGFYFPGRAGARMSAQIVEIIKTCIDEIDDFRQSLFLNMNELSELDRHFLMERHLISPNFVKQKKPAALIVGKNELISIMINEEDHLRIQSLQSGFEIEKAWRQIHQIDDILSKHVEYSYSDELGYLTACPTNTGTGMRVSVFINLPALAISKQIDDIIHDIAPSEIAIRGFFGEGTDSMGNFFQISNQLTLGRTEQSIINRVNNIAEQLVLFELNARTDLTQNNSIIVEDQIARAIGILKYAKILNSVELVNYLSILRLAVALGIIDTIEIKDLNELLVLSQPAHLQKLYNKKFDSDERDILRVNLIRKKLKF